MPPPWSGRSPPSCGSAAVTRCSTSRRARGSSRERCSPLGSLREILAERIGGDRVREGVAEAIPLPDASVDGVTVADAFHWFDRTQALAEIRRVLRPGGGLAIVMVVPDWAGASWAHELGTLVQRSRPEHPHFDGPPWQEAVRAAGGWTEPHEIRVTTSHPVRAEQVIDHLASMSWIAAMTDRERDATLSEFRSVIEGGETPAELPVHFVIGLTALV
jgi:SAM-dependent methyltransferase